MRPLALAALVLIIVAAVSASRSTADQALTLPDRMALIEADWKRLKKQIPRPAKNPDSLALIGYIQEQAVLAKRMVPSLAAEREGADREAFVTAYRLAMIEMLQGLLEMERALIDGDNRAAFAAAKEIGVLQIRSHKKFRPEEEE